MKTIKITIITKFNKHFRQSGRMTFGEMDNLLNELERVEVRLVDGLKIFESERLVQQTLIEGQSESVVDELAVEQCQRNETTDEPAVKRHNTTMHYSSWDQFSGEGTSSRNAPQPPK